MYLIDGHNLIGQLQDISLEDPQDEAKLTQAVRRYCMRARVQATIIFDNGIVGGLSRELSSYDVKVVFAPHGVQADGLLMRRAREHGTIKGNYGSMILVSSDRRITQMCFAYGIETMPSEEFALLLGLRPIEREEEVAPGKSETRVYFTFEKDPDPHVTTEEIVYWLTVFKRKQAQVRAARKAAQDQLNPKKNRPSG